MNIINIIESTIGTIIGAWFVIGTIWFITKIEDAVKKHHDRKDK